MKTLKEKDYTINICTDIIEWAKEFYDMPEDAELGNEEEVSSECMGFASIDEKILWVFVPKKYDLKELKETIAHEIGHIIEMEYPTNPEQIESNDELHELKADHYMNFYLLVDKIVDDIILCLNNN
mgnify:CR=1 FL=1